MLYELENRQALANFRYPTPTPRPNGTKFQPNDPFTIPQTPKMRSRPVSPEPELGNGSRSPLLTTSPRVDLRGRRLSRSLRRSNAPYPRVSSPPYNFRDVSSPSSIQESYGPDTPKDLASRAKIMRHARNSRSQSPRGRYNVNHDQHFQLSPSFSWPLSPVSPIKYLHKHGETVDSFSSNSVLLSPRPRYQTRSNLQDLPPSFYSPSPNVATTTQEYHESKILFAFKRTPPSEDTQSFIAPEPVSRPPPPQSTEETSDIDSRHVPESNRNSSTASPVPSKHDDDPQTNSAPVSGRGDSTQQVNEPERFTIKEYATFFVTDTIPRQLYLIFLFRLPALYFVRVARIFEEADLSLEEIGEMAVNAVNAHADGLENSNSNSNTKHNRLKDAWELLITRLVREWETFNYVSVLLLPAIVTMFQIQGATNDPVTRYIAFWSLICALLSSLYDCLFIICFPTMRKPHKAAEWAVEALKTQKIFWNVWVMLAMPAVWICWSILTFIMCIMSYMWRSRADLPPDYRFTVAPSTELAMRVLICVVLGLGAAYGFLIFTTLSRFGSGMDKAWKARAEAFYAPPMHHTIATPLPEYRANDHPETQGTSTTRATEPGQDHPGSANPNRDQGIVNTKHSASEPSNPPPAYPPTPNPSTYPPEKSSQKSLVPPSPTPSATRRNSWQHHHRRSQSGRTDTFQLTPPRRNPINSSPQQLQTYNSVQSSDDQKSSDESEGRGRSEMAHSRSRSDFQDNASYLVGTSRGSPEVRIKRPDNERGHTIIDDPFFIHFNDNNGDILLEDIRDRDPDQTK